MFIIDCNTFFCFSNDHLNSQFLEVVDGCNGSFQAVEPPFSENDYPAAIFDKTPAMIRRHAPALGEHSVEILRELELSSDEIDALCDEGVIGVAG